ncbi:hypothetical protein HF086_017091 [Spodoptera exigua]|uniref:Uncharacterized protein n=1 Tax=Spodoptera exigua TaxID=7107 RepID=A0A922MMC6_SPOEX|nr:hypothetical protein HF086_017091 [Spodoptera exigua]
MKYQCLILIISVAWCSAQLSDDMQMFDPECMTEEKFPCMGGGCISVSQYCDGKLDCDDGSDENFCIEHKPFQEFCNETHQYMCQDSTKCVPLSWLCNVDMQRIPMWRWQVHLVPVGLRRCLRLSR